MKKLLVLAAVAAMAMGAKAEHSLSLDGAKSVYALFCDAYCQDRDWVAGAWEERFEPMFFDESVAASVFKGANWAENYANAEAMISPGNKFGGSDGDFSLDKSGYQGWAILALADATAISPGAAYSLYYGTSDLEDGAITLDSTPIASGYLMTDGAAPVPEPTSGLLLLLGVAGLALKRKRA